MKSLLSKHHYQSKTKKNSDKVTFDSEDDDISPQPLFLCPRFQTRILWDSLDENVGDDSEIFSKYGTSPLFDDTSNGHHVLPLPWCNNKEVYQESEECYGCSTQTISTDYYFCVQCDKRFHKECVELPLEISYPSHPKHALQLYLSKNRYDDCTFCRERTTLKVYYCSLCDIFMHPLCAQAPIPFFIDQPKRHDHTLTLFPRQASLTCNVYALVNKLHLTYVCAICDFVIHNDCIYIPQTIKISRHYNHRISFISSLPLQKGFCGVCRRKIDVDFGAYSCNACSGYAVHTRCALGKDVWDGKELEGVPEEDEDVKPPFETIAEGVIVHFSHGCHLKIETNGVYNNNNFCESCALPINEENFYVCVECDFILHETCATAPRKKVHPLHPHQLEQSTVHANNMFACDACGRYSNGFGYRCNNKDCNYILDVVCASTSDPFTYQGHHHPLFLSLEHKEKPMCHICKSVGFRKVFNCIECEFIICFRCATLPYKVRYKHDDHYLTFCHGDEASGSDWCELCEGRLEIGGEKGFYKCNDCCTTFHIICLLGPYPYMKSGQTYRMDAFEFLFQSNSSLSRPVCHNCSKRCPYPIFTLRSGEDGSFIQCSGYLFCF